MTIDDEGSIYWIPLQEAEKFKDALTMCRLKQERGSYQAPFNNLLAELGIDAITISMWRYLTGNPRHLPKSPSELSSVGTITRYDVYSVIYYLFGIYDPRRCPPRPVRTKEGSTTYLPRGISDEEYQRFIEHHKEKLKEIRVRLIVNPLSISAPDTRVPIRDNTVEPSSEMSNVSPANQQDLLAETLAHLRGRMKLGESDPGQLIMGALTHSLGDQVSLRVLEGLAHFLTLFIEEHDRKLMGEMRNMFAHQQTQIQELKDLLLNQQTKSSDFRTALLTIAQTLNEARVDQAQWERIKRLYGPDILALRTIIRQMLSESTPDIEASLNQIFGDLDI